MFAEKEEDYVVIRARVLKSCVAVEKTTVIQLMYSEILLTFSPSVPKLLVIH